MQSGTDPGAGFLQVAPGIALGSGKTGDDA